MLVINKETKQGWNNLRNTTMPDITQRGYKHRQKKQSQRSHQAHKKKTWQFVCLYLYNAIVDPINKTEGVGVPVTGVAQPYVSYF